jgi:hypothetical protein
VALFPSQVAHAFCTATGRIDSVAGEFATLVSDFLAANPGCADKAERYLDLMLTDIQVSCFVRGWIVDIPVEPLKDVVIGAPQVVANDVSDRMAAAQEAQNKALVEAITRSNSSTSSGTGDDSAGGLKRLLRGMGGVLNDQVVHVSSGEIRSVSQKVAVKIWDEACFEDCEHSALTNSVIRSSSEAGLSATLFSAVKRSNRESRIFNPAGHKRHMEECCKSLTVLGRMMKDDDKCQAAFGDSVNLVDCAMWDAVLGLARERLEKIVAEFGCHVANVRAKGRSDEAAHKYVLDEQIKISEEERNALEEGQPAMPRSQKKLMLEQRIDRLSHGSGDGTKKGRFDEGSGAQPCRLFTATGTCKFGASCKFSHSPSNARSLPQGGPPQGHQNFVPNQQFSGPPPCRDFGMGRCTRGAGCRFSHPGAPQSFQQPQGQQIQPQGGPPQNGRWMQSPNQQQYNQQPPGVCYDFLRGSCNRVSCKFAHSGAPPQGGMPQMNAGMIAAGGGINASMPPPFASGNAAALQIPSLVASRVQATLSAGKSFPNVGPNGMLVVSVGPGACPLCKQSGHIAVNCPFLD